MKCPKCRTDLDLKDIQEDEDMRTIFELLPVFGPHSRLAFEYCELFGVTPIRKKIKKLCRLLTDIAGLFKTGKFVLNKCEYDVSQRGIVEALTVVNNKNFEQGLKNHNYLKVVLADIAKKERDERRAALDADLRKREETAKSARKDRTDLADRSDWTDEEKILTPEETRKRARELVEKLGARS